MLWPKLQVDRPYGYTFVLAQFMLLPDTFDNGLSIMGMLFVESVVVGVTLVPCLTCLPHLSAHSPATVARPGSCQGRGNFGTLGVRREPSEWLPRATRITSTLLSTQKEDRVRPCRLTSRVMKQDGSTLP